MAAQKKKYEIVREYILESIYGGMFQPNMMIMSESDLCKIFKVSRIVVRHALDELVAKGVLYKIQGKGTFVEKDYAKNLAKIESKKVGIIVPRMSHFIEKITSALCAEFSRQSYFYKIEQVGNNQDAEIQSLKTIASEGVNGVIIFTSYADHQVKKLADYINAGIPIVFIDRFVEEWPFDAVVGMDYEAGKDAVKHLHEVHGISRIGFFSSERAFITSVAKRCEGVIDGLKELKLPVNREVLHPVNMFQTEKFDTAETIDHNISLSIERFLDSPFFDCEAVVISNDITAVNFINVCERKNIRIPEDLKIISFMNDMYANLISPSLTTFDQNVGKLGYRAAKQLIKRIEGEDVPPEIIRIPYKLVTRNSCGCTCEW